MYNFSIAVATLLLAISSSGVSAREVQALPYKFDTTNLGPAQQQASANDSLNVISAEAAIKVMFFKEDSAKRGAAEASIYKKVSAGTVLIATEDGLGSGAVITSNGHIITNQHVVGNAKKVKVFFKPNSGSNEIADAIETSGTVLKVNTQSDLALVKVDKIPTNVRPIPFKLDGPPVIGEDAHAIGHPRGEVWSYTRGYVSQYRTSYVWNTGKSDPSRSADVIQTQTPINPGNSGGPLVNAEGQLIGLNSFGQPQSPGLNFAVAVSTIQNFLKQEGSYIEQAKASNPQQSANSATKCGKEPIGQKKGQWKTGPATTIFFDPGCKGRATVVKIVPEKADEPIVFFIQDKESGDKSTIALYDFDRDGRIDWTLVDVDGDGNWDMEGDNLPGESVASVLKPVKKG